MANGTVSAKLADVDTSLDRYARMVRRSLSAPLALVSLVESDRQVFCGASGLDQLLDSLRETPLSHSFCQYVVVDQAPLVITDARVDPRLHTNLAIRDLDVIAYAGWPITDHTGEVIGSLCAIDHEPRVWADDELAALEDLAAACSAELAQRSLRVEAAAGEQVARDLAHRSRVLLALSEGLSHTRTLIEVAGAVERTALVQLGCRRAGIWLRDPGEAGKPLRLPAHAPTTRGENLTFVVPPTDSWESATRHAVLGVDSSNPVGDALVMGRATYYTSRAEQNARFPSVVNDAQIGESRAFVPLVANQTAYGVLALVWDEVGEVPPEHRTTISALASYTAQAVQRALLHEEQRHALGTLQSALMPQLPPPGVLELAARYRPASRKDQVGGDWYDAVVMPSGQTAVMIGDVVGHDIGAAAIMGQLRNMLRAFAWATEDAPSTNVGRLDQAMEDLHVDAMASLVYARIEPMEDGNPHGADGWHLLRWTNAGHPPPVLVDADGTLTWLDESPDLMLGVLPGGTRGDHRTPMPPDSTLLLYTDGLVERRSEDLDLGLERLGRAVARHRGRGIDAFLDGVLGDLLGHQRPDDVAALAVRFNRRGPAAEVAARP